MSLTREFSIFKPFKNPKAVVVMVPPCQCDGLRDVEDPKWRDFAVKNHLALVSCFFRDETPGWIEDYCNMKYGAGDALIEFLRKNFDPVPKLLLWGFSAGGQFNYEFVNKHPEMVAAFVVNKGGVYYTAMSCPEARNIPGLFFIGGQDEEFRQNILRGIFTLNKRAGAVWHCILEPYAHHVYGVSEYRSMSFFEDALKDMG